MDRWKELSQKGNRKHADMEGYNDFNSDLVNLFKCVKYHCPELQRELSCMLNSRELFEDFKVQYNTRGMTHIQKAARFFMLLKTSYGSGRDSFGCIKKNIKLMKEYLSRIENRLSGVVIENKDFEDLIHVYDKTDAFIYLDLPYYGTEKYYQIQLSEQDHIDYANYYRLSTGGFYFLITIVRLLAKCIRNSR